MSNKNNVISITKATNRELPEEAYTPQVIGTSLVEFFKQSKFNRDEGVSMLKDIVSLLSKGEHEEQQVHNFVLSFTNHGVTPDELLEGVKWVVDEVIELDKAYDILQGNGEGDGKSTIH